MVFRLRKFQTIPAGVSRVMLIEHFDRGQDQEN